MRSIRSATSRGLWLTEAPVGYNSELFRRRVGLSDGGVGLHWCTVLSAQRLSGPVEHDKASESRSSLAQGANRDMDSRFQNVPVWAKKKPCDSPVTEQSVVGDLHSEGYTKARSLGLTVCLTADLEKLNLTAKYCGPEQACTVRCDRRSWVLRLHCLIQTCWVQLLLLLAWMDAFFATAGNEMIRQDLMSQSHELKGRGWESSPRLPSLRPLNQKETYQWHSMLSCSCH